MLAQIGLWNDKLKGNLFFSPGKTYCDVAIGYSGTKSFKVEDKNGHPFLLDAKINNQNSVLLNSHNVNLEKEQLSTLTELKNLLNQQYIYKTNNCQWQS